jgi:hypothetical protein
MNYTHLQGTMQNTTSAFSLQTYSKYSMKNPQLPKYKYQKYIYILNIKIVEFDPNL